VLATLPPDPNRGATAQKSAVQNVAPSPPAITPPAHSAYVQNAPTPPDRSRGHGAAVRATAGRRDARQFPPSHLPRWCAPTEAAREVERAAVDRARADRARGGGVAAYFATRPQTNTQTDEPTPTPTPEPPPTPGAATDAATAKDPWAGGDTPSDVQAPHTATRDKAMPSGTVYEVTRGVKLVVPHGYQVQQKGSLIAAGSPTAHLMIGAGPLVTGFTRSERRAMELRDAEQPDVRRIQHRHVRDPARRHVPRHGQRRRDRAARRRLHVDDLQRRRVADDAAGAAPGCQDHRFASELSTSACSCVASTHDTRSPGRHPPDAIRARGG